MDIRFQAGGTSAWKAPVIIVFACKGEDPSLVCSDVAAAAPWFAIAPGRIDFSGESGETALFHGHPDLDIPRVLAVGLGAKEKVTPHVVRLAAATALARCRGLGLEAALVPASQCDTLPGGRLRLVEEITCGALLGLYRYTSLKTPTDEDKPDPRWLAFGFVDTNVPDADQAAARRGERAAQAVTLARNLANTPPNLLPPVALAQAAADVCSKRAMRCTIIEPDELALLGCNALLAVGQGSAHEPRLVIMEHAPAGHTDENPIVLVGKGLTFDSGGISLKPAANMHLMKSDMAAAAAIIGAMDAIGEEAIPRRVVAILACAENMPDGNAMRPGDVVTSLSGKTVEILNTDAEGRLVLCDALTYAQKEFTPACIIDMATLTGACAVALGQELAGLFCDDSALTQAISAAGGSVGDNFWSMPLWQGYQEQLHSEVADIAHVGPREGGAINAALFLKNFVNDGVRWAHLDIAGTDWAFKKTALCPVGAVGFGTRMLIELVRGGV